MKRIITCFAIVAMSLSVNAQKIKLYDKAGTLLNDQTLIFWHAVDTTINQGSFEHKKFVSAFNNTNDTVYIDVTRVKVNGIPGTTDQLCWGTNCYSEPAGGSSNWVINDPVKANPMDTASGVLPLQIYLLANKNVGEALFRYDFVDINDRTIYSSVFVNFSLSYLTGLTEQEIAEFGFDIYPNPSKRSTTMQFKSTLSFREQYVEVLDITGKLVSKNDVPVGSNEFTLNTTSISSGVYFVRLIAEGVQVETKKIIIE